MASDLVPIPSGSVNVVVGDSLVDTSGGTVPTMWTRNADLVEAQRQVLYPGAPPATWIFDGHSGQGITYILDHLQANVKDHFPLGRVGNLWVPGSINDNGQSAWINYLNQLRSLMSQLYAWRRINICIPDCLMFFEKWDSVTGWGPNLHDAAIGPLIGQPLYNGDGINPQLDIVATEYGAKRWRLRELLLAIEQANNATPIVGTVHGNDSYIGDVTASHPTNPFGQTIMAAQLFTLVTIPPPSWMPIHP